jgi:hypothetical protein
LINWRKGGANATGANAGNFSLVAAEVSNLIKFNKKISYFG